MSLLLSNVLKKRIIALLRLCLYFTVSFTLFKTWQGVLVVADEVKVVICICFFVCIGHENFLNCIIHVRFCKQSAQEFLF